MARLTAEQLNATAENVEETFTFKEAEVEIEELGGSVLLRELPVGRRGKLLKGITDENGNVKDVTEFQVRLLAASCIEPPLATKEVRKWLPKWPSGKADELLDPINRLGGDKKKEAANAEAEFQEADES